MAQLGTPLEQALMLEHQYQHRECDGALATVVVCDCSYYLTCNNCGVSLFQDRGLLFGSHWTQPEGESFLR